MDYEIWSSESGNRLAAFRALPEAYAWLFDLWTREGDAGIKGLSLGDQEDRWVIAGDSLNQVLRDFLSNGVMVTTSSSTTTQALRPTFLGWSVAVSPGPLAAVS